MVEIVRPYSTSGMAPDSEERTAGYQFECDIAFARSLLDH